MLMWLVNIYHIYHCFYLLPCGVHINNCFSTFFQHVREQHCDWLCVQRNVLLHSCTQWGGYKNVHAALPIE